LQNTRFTHLIVRTSTQCSPSEADNITHNSPFKIQEVSLPFSQEAATGPYSEPDESNEHLHILFKKLG